MTDGALWKSHRNFISRNKFGLKFMDCVGTQIESRVQSEVTDCLLELLNDAGAGDAALDPAPYLSCSLSNVICSIIMSTRFRHKDAQFNQFMNFFDDGFRLFKQTGSLIFLPFLRHLPAKQRIIRQLQDHRGQLLDFMGEIIDEHRATFAHGQPRDLVDIYLQEMAEEGEEQLFGDKDPETQLKQVLIDLFSAGFETVKSTLLWTLIHVLRNPEVRAKVQAELARELEPTQLPGMEDMSRLPYSKAVIYESMRRTSAVPLGVTHSNTRYLFSTNLLLDSICLLFLVVST